jgi:hypothetical protein
MNEWITHHKFRAEDGRTIEIIQNRNRPPAFFIREITPTQIRDHHFPEIRTRRAIRREALAIMRTDGVR